MKSANRIGFAERDDATELIKALAEEGYRTELAQGTADTSAWVLTVEPFDDRVVDMVDVYGGWLAGDSQLPD